MRPSVLLAAAAAVGLAWYVSRNRGAGDGLAWGWADNLDQPYITNLSGGVVDGINEITGALTGAWDEITGGFLNYSKMRAVTAADVRHTNVRAFVAVIRQGEGTADSSGYRRIFGGELFESYADHPRKRVTKTFKNGKTVTSSAAGVGQFLASTWDETARNMRLADFSPANQDLALVGRIALRNALDDVKAGRFEQAIKKVAKEWASMPGSPYGQPVITMETAKSVYSAAGGAFA